MAAEMYRCEDCPYRTKSGTKFIDHRHRHMTGEASARRGPIDHNACSRSMDLLQCELCEFTTSLRVLLDRHVTNQHKDGQSAVDPLDLMKKYRCRFCRFKSASTVVELVNHSCYHKDQRGWRREQYRRWWKKELIWRYVHRFGGPTCHFCFLRYNIPSELRLHMLWQHSSAEILQLQFRGQKNMHTTRRSPSRSEEGNKSKEMDNEMKTMIREIREDRVRIREENKVLREELEAVREEMRGREEKWQVEKADWMKRMKMIEEKMEQREKR
ncbi:hypothetical protein GEV33_001556 [Tenebrio molitor]|uniref:C2H2-type domain-containing protein n=1 Tax=Tenebrio molitor TaxID=7067 RepID=A0A8J6HUZ9_TENMO|nr:hypothetical protein GEV33_001556 [Tenebrio molitor]